MDFWTSGLWAPEVSRRLVAAEFEEQAAESPARRREQGARVPGRGLREVLAKALIALAVRLAPAPESGMAGAR
jgi:hypothetical protein